MRFRGVLTVLLVVVVAALLVAPLALARASSGHRASGRHALAASSSANRILFVRGAALWSCRPDGSGQRRLAGYGADSPGGISAACWSPDHRSIAFIRYPNSRSQNGALWRMKADGSGQRRISYSGPSLTYDCGDLAWSPDGRYIAGGNFYGPVGHLAILDLQTMTSRDVFTLLPSVNGIDTLSWSPDQSQLLVVQEGGDSTWLMRVDAQTGTLLQNYSDIQHGISSASYAPDGQSMVYSYADLNTMEFGLRIATIAGATVSDLGSGYKYRPLWSPDGKSIAYSKRNGVQVLKLGGGSRLIVKNGFAEAWR